MEQPTHASKNNAATSAFIGVFDSGLGGLTVAREIMRSMPQENILYVGDTARCPYGPRNLHEVRDFVFQICSFFQEQGVKMIVIACNTATAAGLTAAQQYFDIPIIGVVEPGARAAIRTTRNRRVGVIATTGCIGSGVYARAVRALDAGVTVYSVATPLFVDMVEEGLVFDASRNPHTTDETSDVYITPRFYSIARDYLRPLKSSGIDTLVLGCTHFPLLSTTIGQVMGPEVTLVSSAQETAREVAETLLQRTGMLPPVGEALNLQSAQGDFAPEDGDAEVRARDIYYTTGSVEEFSHLGSRIIGHALGDVRHLPLEKLQAWGSAPEDASSTEYLQRP